MADDAFRVEVVYATPERQWLIALDVAPGTTVSEAIHCSGLPEQCPGIDLTNIGVFGERVSHHHRLEPGDRIEIYRPLIADPKDARRELARQGKSMGQR